MGEALNPCVLKSSYLSAKYTKLHTFGVFDQPSGLINNCPMCEILRTKYYVCYLIKMFNPINVQYRKCRLPWTLIKKIPEGF